MSSITGFTARPELIARRAFLHSMVDPLWRSGRFSRDSVYKWLATVLMCDVKHISDMSVPELDRCIKAALSSYENSNLRHCSTCTHGVQDPGLPIPKCALGIIFSLEPCEGEKQ